MAPMAPSGKKQLLERLRKEALPLAFGAPHPSVCVVEQDGVFRLRQLVVDPQESEAAGRQALAAGENWMPEHHFALARPTGKVFLEAPTRDALAKKIEAYDWPGDW
ncbi:MAG: hypothetical protein H6Q89_3588 [Myxococcaceae bacterium]|nr:hypothetical protein [Myxococcaceae bacterium]